MKLKLRTALSLVLLLSAPAWAQTLSQNTNSTVITGGLSVACTQNAPLPPYTLENGFFRSFALNTQPGNINVTSIRFGVDFAATSLATIPLTIRLFNDSNGGAPSPYAGLTLRHTENFTIAPSVNPFFVVQAMTGAPVTFAPTETLVVEVFAPSLVAAQGQFYIGANSLGQTAACYLRSGSCGVNDPTSLAVPPLSAPNVHQIIEVNYASASVAFPGTGEDLQLLSAINANPLTIASPKNANSGNTVTLQVTSPGGTFTNRELVVIAQGFVTGSPPFPPVAANIHMSLPGLVILLGGDVGPFGPVVLPAAGTTLSFVVPPGLAGNSAIFQAVIVTFTAPLALNGLYASTIGHEIRIM